VVGWSGRNYPGAHLLMLLCFVLIIQFKTINTGAGDIPINNNYLRAKVEEMGRYFAELWKNRGALVEEAGKEVENSGSLNGRIGGLV